MQFDFLTSNPAFNIAEESNIAGTGGNTTLYRKATRYDFDNRLKPDGILLNITLKGIIPDLINGHFKDKQTHLINLMDNLDVWPYNTCYFLIENANKTTSIKIAGGLAKKIYSADPNDCFKMTYYSGSNRGMDNEFNGTNKVIRQLPGRGRDTVAYDYTDKKISTGPKFAFYVMESRKSYTVTTEPIMGGTICYISTNTTEEAEKLKLFTLNNPIYKKYIKRMHIKNHAFGLRNIKKFDLNQIVTGEEIPKEWGITDNDLIQPTKIENEVLTDVLKRKSLGQVFTPKKLIEIIFKDLIALRPDAFSNPKYTFCDSMCGNGKFLSSILEKKMSNNISHQTALESIYGIDIDSDAVEECKNNLIMGNEALRKIVDEQIICGDMFEYTFPSNNFNKLFV